MYTNIENEIVITSRIRLARNLKNYKFPTKMSQEDAINVIKDIQKSAENCECHMEQSEKPTKFSLHYMKDIPEIDKNVLIEKHIISPDLAEKKDRGAFLLSTDEKTSIFINEEDHIRIQVLGSGLNLRKCWNLCSNIDDMFEETIEYAFDKELGYITSCPTNIGTGMRASVMLHLPALSITSQTEKLLSAVSQLGVAVRGVYGEGTKSMGHLYQISNQGTLGVSEETLIDKITQITTQIIEKEKRTRKQLIEKNRILMEDQVYRAYGILSNARSISTEEAMRLLSITKLGNELKILDSFKENWYELMTQIQPNSIQIIENGELNMADIDIKRANIIREKLSKYQLNSVIK